jgi:membrane-associated phospholipid phosphatase
LKKHKSHIIAIVYLVAIGICILFIDKPLAYFFLKSPPFLVTICKGINLLIAPAINVLLWPIIFYVAYFLIQKKKLGDRLLLIALSVNVANLIVFLLKRVFGRYRPDLLFSEELYGFHLFTTQKFFLSFPSAHAVTLAAILFSILCFYPRYFYLFTLLGLFISLSRVIVEAHYLSDVIAAFLIGMLTSTYIHFSMQKSSFCKS